MAGNILMNGAYNINFYNEDNFISANATILTIGAKSYITFAINNSGILKYYNTYISPYNH